MGNDMTWEQKCRISALRAACASQYDFRYVKDSDDIIGAQPESDEEFTKRILARAEAFRIALLVDGALDYTPDDEGASEIRTASGLVYEICPGCGSSRKDTPLMIGDGVGCDHKWHRE